MNTDKTHQKVRIFVASPSDVAEERERVREVAEELNRTRNIADFLGFTLEVLDWRTHVTPQMGRPEGVILEALPVTMWDIFVGILWQRFGTPTGAIDPKTGRIIDSGTKEEFDLAYNAWKTTGSRYPKVLFYRCARDVRITEIDPVQLNLVNTFFKNFAPDAEHPGLHQEFVETNEFERRVRQDLIRLLVDNFHSLLAEKFSLNTPRETDLLNQISSLWDGLSLLTDLIGAVFSDDTAIQLQHQRQKTLERLTRLVGGSQAILVHRDINSGSWRILAASGGSISPGQIDLSNSVVECFMQGDKDYISLSANDALLSDPFYRIFDASRKIENFPVWLGGQFLGFVTFSSIMSTFDHSSAPLFKAVKSAIRLLVCGSR
jgi:hypothetical protein